jgi:hypothetical protein
VQAPNSDGTDKYPILETFAALGSQSSSKAETPQQVLDNTWKAFIERKVSRPDGLRLSYWKDVNPDLPPLQQTR